jgi:hypothetical protein
MYSGGHSPQLRLIPYLHHTSSVLRYLPLELLSEIFNEGGIKIISLSNIRPIIIYFHSLQCRLIPYLHQRPIFFKTNSSIVAILELIRGAQCWIEVIRSSGEEMWRVDAYQIPYYSRGIEGENRTHPRFADCCNSIKKEGHQKVTWLLGRNEIFDTRG